MVHCYHKNNRGIIPLSERAANIIVMAILNRLLYLLYKRQRMLFTGSRKSFLFTRHVHSRCIEPIASRFFPLFTRSVMISITRRCQCSCPHCGTADEPNEEMGQATIKGIIDTMSSNLGPQLYLFGGEPLLHPDLLEIVKYAKKKPLFVTIDTNGILLDEKKVAELKDAGVDLIHVSIDSHLEEVHDRLRGCPGVYAKAVKGIENCRDQGVPCHLSTYATRENLRDGDLKGVIDLGQRLGVPVRILSPMCAGRWARSSEVVLVPDDIRLLRNLLEKDRVYWEEEFIDTPDAAFHCSGMMKFFIYISTNGDVQPCCYLPTSFGNVHQEPLKRIVGRMHDSDMFKKEKWCNCGDCPANIREFREKYLS